MSEAHDKSNQKIGKDDEEEEYVLLELDDCLYSDISPGAPFVLSGLDTLAPTLVVGDGMKMIGGYEETVGTCYLFSESETQPKPNAEMPPYGENKDKADGSTKEGPSKEVKHLASVEKILKLRLVSADGQQGGACQHKDRENLKPYLAH